MRFFYALAAGLNDKHELRFLPTAAESNAFIHKVMKTYGGQRLMARVTDTVSRKLLSSPLSELYRRADLDPSRGSGLV
ncbi:hypothetical protein [Arenibacterium halophilum]|uniref:Uncharacterized protein n=1 Tax=Arenibacterium halophilum TaxID=2583821 RepID=A0ABY2XEX7_9RHOB|nr:hypothetical protein [Arenibacterium halophilum]TMV14925.1 hypothetical protein FGK64_02805 [Arenibacterium halophilum]